MNKAWFVYIVRCADKTLYTGITTDLDRRLNEHNHCDKLGARYTRHRRPITLSYWEIHDSRSAAAKREHAIKQMPRTVKEALMNNIL